MVRIWCLVRAPLQIDHRYLGRSGNGHALRWILTNQEVSTVIPSANSIDEMRENVTASDLAEDAIDNELLRRCSSLPDRTDVMIELLGHPFDEVRFFAKDAVVSAVGEDHGFDKHKYKEQAARLAHG